MSDVIRVLEDPGRNPGISVSRSEQYVATIAASTLDMPQRHAFLDRDVQALNGLVGARDTLRCVIATPE